MHLPDTSPLDTREPGTNLTRHSTPGTSPLDPDPLDTNPRETEPRETEPRETEPRETEPRATERRKTERRETEPRETERCETEPRRRWRRTRPHPASSPSSAALARTPHSGSAARGRKLHVVTCADISPAR